MHCAIDQAIERNRPKLEAYRDNTDRIAQTVRAAEKFLIDCEYNIRTRLALPNPGSIVEGAGYVAIAWDIHQEKFRILAECDMWDSRKPLVETKFSQRAQFAEGIPTFIDHIGSLV